MAFQYEKRLKSLYSVLLATAASIISIMPPIAMAEESKNTHSINIMVYNIWNNGASSKMWDEQKKQEGKLVYNQTMQQLLQGVKPDVFIMPELYNNSNKNFNGQNVAAAHVSNTLEVLNSFNGSSRDYVKNPDYDSRTGSGMIFANGKNQYLGDNTIRHQASNSFPEVYIEGRHLNYADSPTTRINQVRELAQLLSGRKLPTILAGDLNAGDISERGLQSAHQQATLFARMVTDSSASALWKELAIRYIPAGQEEKFLAYYTDMQTSVNGVAKYRRTINDYFNAHRDEFPGINSISNMSWRQWEEIIAKDMASKGLVFEDETYPIEGNIPQTMNVLKQNFQLLQLDRNREQFAPSVKGDDRATWTSNGEDATNIWEGWDRVTIDHILVSRPFAKWVEIVDNGQWSGILSAPSTLPNGNSLSDHEPIAQELRWTGPIVQAFDDNGTEKARIIWNRSAYNFEGRNREFYLTRNNNRNDVYLGQVADYNGNPILTGLTLAEKKTLLDCHSEDGRFQQAIRDYCIDDHSFIDEVVVGDGGTLVIDEDAALGNSNAHITLNNGGVKIIGKDMVALNKAVQLDGPGWFTIDSKNAIIAMQQTITGEGSFIKQGEGTLVLNAANDYRGGTLIEGGVLRANTVNSLVNDTAFAVNAGTLDLNGYNLKMSSLSGMGGTIALNGANLELDQAQNSRFNGNLTGQGDFIKSGVGALVLNGQNNISGTTFLRSGQLIIGDSAHQNASIQGVVQAQSGTNLSGIGTIGSLYAMKGAVIAPGNSIGSLRVNGDAVFENGAIYHVDINPQGDNDLLAVAGKATIDGAYVYVEKAAGTYVPGHQYQILTAGHGVNGTFGLLNQNMPFIDMDLSYAKNSVYLNIARNNVDFVSLANSPNQRAIAPYIEALNAGNPIYDSVVMQENADDVRAAYNALSGEIYATNRMVLLNETATLRNAAFERLNTSLSTMNAGSSATMSVQEQNSNALLQDTPRAAFWTQAIGQWGEAKGDGNAAKAKTSTGGILIGYDIPFNNNWRLGGLAGYSRTNVKVDERLSSGHNNNYHFGFYLGGDFDGTTIKAGLGYSHHKIDLTRYVQYVGFSEKLSGDYDANALSAFGEIAHRFELKPVSLEPFANLAVIRLKTDDFSENGGFSKLNFAKETTTTSFSTLGMRLFAPIDMEASQGKLSASLGWQHGFGDRLSQLTTSFSNTDSFIIEGLAVPRNSAIINAGVDFNVAKNMTLSAQYTGQFGSKYQQNGVRAIFKANF